MDFRLTGEVGEKMAGKRENHRKQSVAGQRDRKVSVLFSSRQSDLRNFNKLHLHLANFLELFFGGIDLITLTLTLLNVFELGL